MTGQRKRRIAWPWLTRGGRFSSFKASAFAACFLPLLALLARWGWWGLGARPLTEAIHQTGLWAIRFLLITLAITPARYVLRWPQLVVLRRMLGLAALAYALLHLVLYAADQAWSLPRIGHEILHRVYLTIGFVTLLGLVVLGVTSADRVIRSMGRRWKQLHRLIFLLAPLGVLHFFMQSKADVSEPAIMAGLLAWLLLWRVLPGAWRASPLGLILLLLCAPMATIVVEYGWYAVATHIPARRILAANWTPRFWPRPADWVAVSALAAALLAGGRALISDRVAR